MSADISSFEILDQEIQKTKGKPRVLQALWDGDTQGWWLSLSLYAETPSVSKYLVCHYLGRVESYDGRQKEELAKELAKKAIEKYGLEFYFPSPDDADDACPDWMERDKAIACEGCGKLIMPDRDSCLPKEICYHCYLERERNRDLIEDKLQEYGVSQYRCKGRHYQGMRSCGYMEDFAMFPYISEALKRKIGTEGLSILTLEKKELLSLSEKLEARLDVLAPMYKKAALHDRNGKVISMFRDQSYKGKRYTLDSYHDPVHEEMAELLYSYNTTQEVIKEKGCFKFFITAKGYSYRAARFKSFISYTCKGRTTIDRVYEHYKKLLTKEQVLSTLQKLERLGCISIKEDVIKITHLGKYAS